MPDELRNDEPTPLTNKPTQDLSLKSSASEAKPSFSSPVGTEVEPATNTVGPNAPYAAESTSASAAMEAALKDPAEEVPALAPKKSKKKLIIAGSIVALIGVLIAGAAATYALWYQNPDKVITDAMAHALMAKSGEHSGTISYETASMLGGGAAQKNTIDFTTHHTRSTGDASVTFKTKVDEKDVSFTGSVVYDSKNDTYVKVDGLKKVTGTADIGQSYQELSDKYNNKWILFAAEMLKKSSPEFAKTQKCVTDVLKKAESDSSYLQEVGALYETNRFVVVKEKLGDKNGNLGYVVTIDEQKLKAFSERMKTTKLQKEIATCSGSATKQVDDAIDAGGSSSKTNPRVEVWINRWTHQLAEVHASDSQDGSTFTMNVVTNFTKPVTITTPSGAVSAEELMKDFEQSSQTSMVRISAELLSQKADAYNAANSKYPTLDELKAAKDEAAADTEVDRLVGTVAPTAQSTTKIQYKLCGPKQPPAIGYYDETKKAVVPVENSTTCKL